jgi:DNA-binding NarL/FixJ family response regulator
VSLLAAGIPMREVARRLQLSPATARHYEALVAAGGALLHKSNLKAKAVL